MKFYFFKCFKSLKNEIISFILVLLTIFPENHCKKCTYLCKYYYSDVLEGFLIRKIRFKHSLVNNSGLKHWIEILRVKSLAYSVKMRAFFIWTIEFELSGSAEREHVISSEDSLEAYHYQSLLSPTNLITVAILRPVFNYA